jgi:hypothetical protein
MAVEKEFETETMAQIYADQGHYEKAAVIYRRLLMQAPAREDLRDRLKAVEDLQKSTGDLHLSTQFGEFINLLLKKKKIDKLRNLRKPRQR